MADLHLPPADRPPPNSFRDAVTRPSIPINEITDLKIGSSFRGEPALLYSNEEFARLAAPFDKVLVGQFTTTRPNMEFIRKGF